MEKTDAWKKKKIRQVAIFTSVQAKKSKPMLRTPSSSDF